LVGLVLIILLGIYGISRSKMGRTYVIKAETLDLKSDSGTMVQAKHLVTAINKCVDCHARTSVGPRWISGQWENSTRAI
jgi:hypothetical protein